MAEAGDCRFSYCLQDDLTTKALASICWRSRHLTNLRQSPVVEVLSIPHDTAPISSMDYVACWPITFVVISGALHLGASAAEG